MRADRVQKEGIFKLLRRFVIRCSFCGRVTDCMAIDEAGAGVKFEEKGWRKVELKYTTPEHPEKAEVHLACKGCYTRVEKWQQEKAQVDSEVINNG